MRAGLFVALSLIYLIPIWSVHHLPTSDGPSHLYNAWILRQLIVGDPGAISGHYAIDWRPYPNWVSHAALALLMTALPPVIAEKILFSAIVLLFFAAIWLYAEGGPHAFLAFSFGYHRFMQLGFYNFSIAIALFFVILAVWWRRRNRPDAKTIAIIAFLLLLCYFSHPLPTIFAMMAISVLWLTTLRRRRLKVHARHLIAFVPVVPLLLWFARQQSATPFPSSRPVRDLAMSLVRVDALYSFDHWQAKLGFTITILLVVLAVATQISEPRRETTGYMALVCIFLVLYFFVPLAGGIGGSERVSVFIYLLPLAWFTSRVPQRPLIALLAIIAVVNLLYLFDRNGIADRGITAVLRAVDPVVPGTTVLPLLGQRRPPGLFVPAYSHAVEYTAIEKRLIDLGNYEPDTGYFPVKFREGVPPIDLHAIEDTPDRVDIAGLSDRARYIFTWRVGRYSALERGIEEHYRLISDINGGRLYERSTVARPQIAPAPMILLPIAGRLEETNGWGVRQTVRNIGSSTLHLALDPCADQCEFDIAPGRQVTLASMDEKIPFIRAYPSKSGVLFTTIVSHGGIPVVAVPAVSETAFRRGKIRIPTVRFAAAKLNLRAWFLGSAVDHFSIRIVSRDGRALAQKEFALDASRYFTAGDLARLFPEVPADDSVDVEVASDDTRLWAFISATDFSGARVRLHLPQ